MRPGFDSAEGEEPRFGVRRWCPAHGGGRRDGVVSWAGAVTLGSLLVRYIFFKTFSQFLLSEPERFGGLRRAESSVHVFYFCFYFVFIFFFRFVFPVRRTLVHGLVERYENVPYCVIGGRLSLRA